MKRIRKGFTLIELLVVVAIIGILATIVIINVAKARQKAVDSKVLAGVNAAAKTAAACVNGEEYLSGTPNTANQICLASAGGSGSTTWKDKWADINAAGNSTNGDSWAWFTTANTAPSGTVVGGGSFVAVSYPTTKDDTFQYAATADGATPVQSVECGFNVCVKTW